MRAVKRKTKGRYVMGAIEIFQIIFLIVVFAVGVIGFMKAATSDDTKKD